MSPVLGSRTAMDETTDGLEALVTACRHGAGPAACLADPCTLLSKTKASESGSTRQQTSISSTIRRSASLPRAHELPPRPHQRPRIQFGRKTRTRGLETRRVIVDVSRPTSLLIPKRRAMTQSRPTRSQSPPSAKGPWSHCLSPPHSSSEPPIPLRPALDRNDGSDSPASTGCDHLAVALTHPPRLKLVKDGTRIGPSGRIRRCSHTTPSSPSICLSKSNCFPSKNCATFASSVACKASSSFLNTSAMSLQLLSWAPLHLRTSSPQP
jgi:hypothetical protein